MFLCIHLTIPSVKARKSSVLPASQHIKIQSVVSLEQPQPEHVSLFLIVSIFERCAWGNCQICVSWQRQGTSWENVPSWCLPSPSNKSGQSVDGWSVAWLVGQSVGWLVDCSVVWLFGWCVCVFVSLYVCVFVCWYVRVLVCWYIDRWSLETVQKVDWSNFLLVCVDSRTVGLSLCWYLCLTVGLSVCCSVSLLVCLLICLLVCRSVYWSAY